MCSCLAAVGTEVDLTVGGLILTSEHDGETCGLGGLIESEGVTVIQIGIEDAGVTARDLVRPLAH